MFGVAPVPQTVRLGPAVRWVAVLGFLGPIAYVVAVVLGGWLWAGYSHYSETISTLTSRGAPNQYLLVPLFAFYNLAVIALAVGLQRTIQARRWGSLGAASLAGAGLTGLVLFFFPQGPWSAPLSGTGVAHTIVAGLDALLFLLAMGFLWRRLGSDPRWSGYGRITLAMLFIGIGLGGFGAASINAPYAGLAERLSIGTFLLWTEVMALGLFRRSHGLTAKRFDTSVPISPA